MVSSPPSSLAWVMGSLSSPLPCGSSPWGQQSLWQEGKMGPDLLLEGLGPAALEGHLVWASSPAATCGPPGYPSGPHPRTGWTSPAGDICAPTPSVITFVRIKHFSENDAGRKGRTVCVVEIRMRALCSLGVGGRFFLLGAGWDLENKLGKSRICDERGLERFHLLCKSREPRRLGG